VSRNSRTASRRRPAALYFPPLRGLVGTEPLTMVELGAVGRASPAGAVTVVLQPVHTRPSTSDGEVGPFDSAAAAPAGRAWR
jgi:hypothetical protein